MVRDFSKLMLRAYNAEADNCVRSMRPHRLTSSIERLNKSRETIARLGNTMSISISDEFRGMRVRELELMSDYLAKVEECHSLCCWARWPRYRPIHAARSAGVWQVR